MMNEGIPYEIEGGCAASSSTGDNRRLITSIAPKGVEFTIQWPKVVHTPILDTVCFVDYKCYKAAAKFRILPKFLEAFGERHLGGHVGD